MNLHQDVTCCKTLLRLWKIQWNVNTAHIIWHLHEGCSHLGLFQLLERVSITLSYETRVAFFKINAWEQLFAHGPKRRGEMFLPKTYFLFHLPLCITFCSENKYNWSRWKCSSFLANIRFDQFYMGLKDQNSELLWTITNQIPDSYLSCTPNKDIFIYSFLQEI